METQRMYMGHLRSEAEIAHMEQLRAQIDAAEKAEEAEAAKSPLYALAGKLGYLYGRWQDESAYEDWWDYIKAAEGFVTELIPGAVFESFTKRPFQLKFYDANGILKWMRATSRQVTWGTVRGVSRG